MKDLQERFEEKYEPVTESGCWIWTAQLDKYGYGRIAVDRNSRLAHRIAYKLYRGEIPKGLHVLHNCDTPSCVNPSHLRVGTHADNMEDRANRKRGADTSGENHSMSKLSDLDVLVIRVRYAEGETQQSLANEFGVSNSLVSNVCTNKTRKHIKEWL